ncbi:RluA family pseudouridine synthase [Stratiformator vulcanicus]|uniref:Pseudouridine synthase n=1 Tax=Stratiformator vulcanicus TaxID=2527980 RepID=A0A517R395_9PLAN|nr:RluA family pseudouridine synthase [Stratiformator vulcanicus]QDT38307.1 Ribosomal large subunit pseudouridine synthase D [Stratiformator vulcanicus]
MPLLVLQFDVTSELHGRRIDVFLERHLRNYTRWRIQRLIAAGVASVNGEPALLARRVFADDRVAVRLTEPPDKLYAPEGGSIPIIFEDDSLMVINKPAGVIAHPVGERQAGTLCNFLQRHLDEQTDVRGLLRPGIVHRLDRMTSGLMVVSKTYEAHRSLTDQFESRSVRKLYLAHVRGRQLQRSGQINRPIGRHGSGTTILMSCAASAIDPRPAVTRFRVVAHPSSQTTLVACVPRTGRNHQIRVHLASIGHPLVGEPFYRPGDEVIPKDMADSDRPLGLHAAVLQFTHPADNRPMRFKSRPVFNEPT